MPAVDHGFDRYLPVASSGVHTGTVDDGTHARCPLVIIFKVMYIQAHFLYSECLKRDEACGARGGRGGVRVEGGVEGKGEVREEMG